ncbi:DUF664 domain-containing protein [Streptomyces koyangensis]|uniref:DUF664 domain-containing protein n=1 Tax=Streptomyces koyangensis TaxID=188770 RepID=A0A385D4H2_9ACTN|nr:DUF664 domain-containing protein [Streptomyces koyangensis]AXQ53236.1 DUF664 domain-containing protein [Streptomyces koyangensis]
MNSILSQGIEPPTDPERFRHAGHADILRELIDGTTGR